MRVIRSRGTPYERGRTVGAGLREEIARSVEFTMSWAAERDADRSRLEHLLAPYDRASNRVVPDLMELLDGIAAGSGVDTVGLRATNACRSSG